jgi:hypothetical protein
VPQKKKKKKERENELPTSSLFSSLFPGRNQFPMSTLSAENLLDLLFLFMYSSGEGNNLDGKLHCQSQGAGVLIPEYLL